jgi:5-methylcytosine-specific restriction protein B
MNENQGILKNGNTSVLDLSAILNQPHIQSIIQEPEFYFQKGQDALKKWMEQSVSEELKNTLISLSKDYAKIQEEATKREDIKQILDLFFEIIAYCDNRAKDKNIYNQYEDKRALADAGVRMNSWVEKLIQYKFLPSEVGAGSTQNAFNYLLEPEQNSTILSENHRKLISENLFKKTYNPDEFVVDLKLFFSDYNLEILNPKNYTHLLMWIVYSIQDKWKEEVVGLMASYGTGWQDNFMQKMTDYDSAIIWNSKRPSGTNETIKILKELIDEKREFPIYYNIRGKIVYKATIVDFVENQEELNKKNWNKELKILDYESNFENYKDDNKKATIVFLAKSLE